MMLRLSDTPSSMLFKILSVGEALRVLLNAIYKSTAAAMAECGFTLVPAAFNSLTAIRIWREQKTPAP
jgi:hypothetical protein